MRPYGQESENCRLWRKRNKRSCDCCPRKPGTGRRRGNARTDHARKAKARQAGRPELEN